VFLTFLLCRWGTESLPDVKLAIQPPVSPRSTPFHQTASSITQPFCAARRHLLHSLKQYDDAHHCWSRAAGLTDEPALRNYLAQRAAKVGKI
jgi:hypothetical protein